MKIQQGDFCPLIGKDCIQFKCKFWSMLRGTNPQTGDLIDEYDCVHIWGPMLFVEAIKEMRGGAAATEDFRNVMLELSKGVSAEVIEQKAMARARIAGNGGS